MPATSEMQIPADRFAQYIDELRELGRKHQVACGTPEDLARFPQAFRDSETFAADFRLLIRSIFLRENRRVAESQFSTLILVAWGGAKAEGPMQPSPSVSRDIRYIIREVLARIATEPSILPLRRSAMPPALPPEAANTESADVSLVVRGYRRLFKVQDKSEVNPRPQSGPVSRGIAVQSGDSSSAVSPTGKIAPIPPPSQPSGAAEIAALGLAGLVIAVLFNLGSMPVFRARVSVLLPSATAGAANQLPGGLQESSLRDGGLTEKVAERLLALPHQNTILRQDALSRGLRDLGLGGNETILYADLVAETAQQVKVRQLQPTNLYEITCDSGNSRFAATFCNEFINVLNEQPVGATSSQPGTHSVRPVDAALGPGIQIYPHWTLSGLAGLVIGCLLGVLVGLVKRRPAKAVPEEEAGTT